MGKSVKKVIFAGNFERNYGGCFVLKVGYLPKKVQKSMKMQFFLPKCTFFEQFPEKVRLSK
jgi:hypothetical protein